MTSVQKIYKKCLAKLRGSGGISPGKNKQIECGLAWYVLLSTTIRVITVVKMLWTRSQQILTTVMTRIFVDKSTYHAIPHSICFLPQYQR